MDTSKINEAALSDDSQTGVLGFVGCRNDYCGTGFAIKCQFKTSDAPDTLVDLEDNHHEAYMLRDFCNNPAEGRGLSNLMFPLGN